MRTAVEQERQQLDGLTEPHVVREAGTEAEGGHLGEPGQAALLVGAQGALKLWRPDGAGQAPALSQAG
jgi:hypothetical protein